MTTTVICDVCKRAIGSATGLVAHMKSMHPNEWRIQQEARLEPATPFRGARPAVAPPPGPPASNGSVTGDLVWEEPPPERKGRGFAIHAELTAKVVELKRHPGRWARVRSYKTTTGAGGSMSMLKRDFPDVEWTARRVEEGEILSAAWGRYVEPEA